MDNHGLKLFAGFCRKIEYCRKIKIMNVAAEKNGIFLG